MDVLNCSDVKRSNEIEKLRRKKEINARYSRLLLSKTIKQFQKQGHVTICLSEKLNGNVDDEKLKNRKLTTNLRLSEPRNRTISFWQFPATLKCEFQIETSPRVALKSVRTQTNFEKNITRMKKPLSTSNEQRKKTTNEILSSHVSTIGNVMSVVMRSQGQNEKLSRSSRNTIKKDPIIRPPRTPTRRYKSKRNMIRSENFWASYNNLFLSNRSIELRISKLFSFPNAQYIVAFSDDFFDCNHVNEVIPSKPKRMITYESGFVIQLMKFNLDECVREQIFVEYVIDVTIQIHYYEQWNMAGSVMSLPFHNRKSVECVETMSSFNGRCCMIVKLRRNALPILLSILILSLVILLLEYKINDCTLFFE